jgi:hypothetical protein
MEPSNEPSASDSEAAFQQVVRILNRKKAWSRRAELIVGVLAGYKDIVGQTQDPGKDKPFDLQAPDDAVRIDVKTQKNGELNVKREKVGKQFLAWAAAGKRFIPVQLVVDSKTKGWYVVPGIPTAARTALDPLDVLLDPENPCKPFCIGECLPADLKTRERFETMRGKLNKGLQDVKQNKEAILDKVSEEYLDYVNEVAKHVIDNDELQAAVLHSISSSDKVMSNLARSDEAMTRLAQSDEAMSKVAQSDEAMSKLAHSDEAMSKLAQSDEAMSKLAQSDEAMLKILGPEMFQIWKAHQSKPAP